MHVGLRVVGGEEEARWMDEGRLGVIQAWGPPGRGAEADRSTLHPFVLCGGGVTNIHMRRLGSWGGGAEGSVKLLNAVAQQKAQELGVRGEQASSAALPCH